MQQTGDNTKCSVESQEAEETSRTGGHNPNNDFHHQYQYRPQSNTTSTNNMGTLDLNISFTTQTTTIPNNKSVTLAPTTTTKKFHVPSVLVLEPKPIGPTPSLIIKNNNLQVVSMGGTATTPTTTTTKQRVPTSPLGRGMVPSEVSDEIDEGIAQAFTEDYSEDLLNLPLPIMESTVNTNADLEDWTKGVVYEGVDIDICGSSHHDLLNHSHNQSTRMINDDPIPLTAPASLTAAVMGSSPTQQTLSQLQSQAQSQSQSQLQLQQRVQHVQQQQQQRIQQLQQLQQVQQQVQQQQQQQLQRRIQQEQQSRVVQQRVQQEQQRRVQQAQQQAQPPLQLHFTQVPPPIDIVVPPPLPQQPQPFTHHLPPPVPVLVHTLQQQQLLQPTPVMVPYQQQQQQQLGLLPHHPQQLRRASAPQPSLTHLSPAAVL